MCIRDRYNHSTPEAIESVKSGKIDFAVVSTPAEVDFPLKQIMLMPFQEILVGGTTFTALGSQELSLREVKNYPMISLGRETMTYKFYNSVFLSQGLDLSPDTEEMCIRDSTHPVPAPQAAIGSGPHLPDRTRHSPDHKKYFHRYHRQ